jgi:hypothetical protein
VPWFDHVFLLNVLREHALKLFLRGEAHPFFQKVSAPIEQVDFRLVVETKSPLEIPGKGVVGIQINKLDPAKILSFKPMNHGRHGAAGTSGKAEEFHELDLTRGQTDRGWVGGFKIWSA